MSMSPGTTNVGICIEGGALHHCLLEHCHQPFLELCNACKSVVCCRVSPMQKAQVRRCTTRRARRPGGPSAACAQLDAAAEHALAAPAAGLPARAPTPQLALSRLLTPHPPLLARRRCPPPIPARSRGWSSTRQAR
jgi:hypothetical protein